MIHYCQKSSTNYYVISFFSHLSFCTLLYDAGTETTNSISPSLDGFHLGPIKKKKSRKGREEEGSRNCSFLFCFLFLSAMIFHWRINWWCYRLHFVLLFSKLSFLCLLKASRTIWVCVLEMIWWLLVLNLMLALF